jgi:hypothetical protein
MNLNEVLGTETKVIDLVARHLDVEETLRLSLVCKQYERFQAKAFKEKFSYEVRVRDQGMKRISLSFCLIHTLDTLDFSHNYLTSIPSEIGRLKSLKYLYLHDNQLTFLPIEIGQLKTLHMLFLDHNQFTSLPLKIEQLRTLWCFHLDKALSPFVPSEFMRGSRVVFV